MFLLVGVVEKISVLSTAIVQMDNHLVALQGTQKVTSLGQLSSSSTHGWVPPLLASLTVRRARFLQTLRRPHGPSHRVPVIVVKQVMCLHTQAKVQVLANTPNPLKVAS